MTAPRTPHHRRRTGTALVVAAGTALALVGITSPGAAAAPPPAPTRLGVVVAGNIAGIPSTAGTPALLVEQLEDVAVTVTLYAGDDPVVVSRSKDTVVRLRVPEGAPGLVRGTGRVVVPGGQSSGTGSVQLSGTGNDVRLLADVLSGPRGTASLTGESVTFDVVRAPVSVTYDQLPTSNVLVSAAGKGVECSPTPDEPTCADLVLPNGLASNVFFATGACDAAAGCPTGGDLLLVLAEFGAGHSNANPATVVVKCDKSRCGGGGVPGYQLRVSLEGDGPLDEGAAPACSSKGVIQAGEEYCVDYVQSKRENAGDLNLFLLLARDARMSCC
jgi:hypothetical protein